MTRYCCHREREILLSWGGSTTCRGGCRLHGACKLARCFRVVELWIDQPALVCPRIRTTVCSWGVFFFVCLFRGSENAAVSHSPINFPDPMSSTSPADAQVSPVCSLKMFFFWRERERGGGERVACVSYTVLCDGFVSGSLGSSGGEGSAIPKARSCQFYQLLGIASNSRDSIFEK